MYVFPRLMGGIGNRLFQVAAAFGYAKRYGIEFTLSRSHIEPNRYTKEDHLQTILRKCPVIENTTGTIEFHEPSECYSTFIDIPRSKANVYLHGYFQNERYFNTYRDDILRLFEIEPERKARLMQMYPYLSKAIFIHIRTYVVKHVSGEVETAHDQHRFDYTRYLKRALKKFNDPEVILLTDNYDLCMKQYSDILIPLGFHYADLSELDSLYLMTMCGKGGICSNSSFSWWGSYLNDSKDKTVVMPREWLKQPWPCNIHSSDAIIISMT